jgi:hypothetical protein
MASVPRLRRTFMASATTSGPMPSPPITASLIVRSATAVPYWSIALRWRNPIGARAWLASAARWLTCRSLSAGRGWRSGIWRRARLRRLTSVCRARSIPVRPVCLVVPLVVPLGMLAQ